VNHDVLEKNLPNLDLSSLNDESLQYCRPANNVRCATFSEDLHCAS